MLLVVRCLISGVIIGRSQRVIMRDWLFVGIARNDKLRRSVLLTQTDGWAGLAYFWYQNIVMTVNTISIKLQGRRRIYRG
jgi:hypothetical protein